MKKPALILLLMILCLLLCSCTSNGISIGGYTYDDHARYTAGGASISGKVEELDISWVEGKVSIAYHDGDEIVLSETAGRKLAQDEELRWWLDGSKLYVKYAASGFNGTEQLDKQLNVLLPVELKLDKATASVVSAGIQTGALAADTINLQTVSGSIDAAVKAAGKLNISAVSGEVSVQVDQLNELEATTVSGALLLRFANVPEKIQANGVSGSVSIRLPENAGFTAEVESVSGDVSGSLPMVSQGEDRYVGGDGQCRISVSTISGDVRLDKMEN